MEPSEIEEKNESIEPTPSPFAEGAIVKLKSGSPAMTVIKLYADQNRQLVDLAYQAGPNSKLEFIDGVPTSAIEVLGG